MWAYLCTRTPSYIYTYIYIYMCAHNSTCVYMHEPNFIWLCIFIKIKGMAVFLKFYSSSINIIFLPLLTLLNFDHKKCGHFYNFNDFRKMNVRSI